MKTVFQFVVTTITCVFCIVYGAYEQKDRLYQFCVDDNQHMIASEIKQYCEDRLYLNKQK